MVEQMPLRKLRAARELTQENLANVLHVKQSEISKIERRTDMYVSTLASYIKAMGGQLEVGLHFPTALWLESISLRNQPSKGQPGKSPRFAPAAGNELVPGGPPPY